MKVARRNVKTSEELLDEEKVMETRRRHLEGLHAGMTNPDASAYANDPSLKLPLLPPTDKAASPGTGGIDTGQTNSGEVGTSIQTGATPRAALAHSPPCERD